MKCLVWMILLALIAIIKIVGTFDEENSISSTLGRYSNEMRAIDKRRL